MATIPSTFSKRYRPTLQPGLETADIAPQQASPFADYANVRSPISTTSPSGVWEPDQNTDDPGGMLAQDRAKAYARGENIDTQLNNRYAGALTDEDYFKRQGMNAYADILGGNGGYSPQDAADIKQTDALNSLEYTPEMANELRLSTDEENAILGDPNKAGQWFDPARLDASQQTTAANLRSQLNTGNDALRSTATAAAGAQRGAIDTDALKMSDAASKGSIDALNENDAAVRGTIDPTALRQSSDFVNRYRMSDADVADLTGRAARSVGNQYGAAETRLLMDAAAQGNTSPLAIAAARNRLMRGSAVDSTDAMTDARIAAKAEQAKREADIEAGRVGDEQAYANLASGTEMGLGNRRVSQLNTNENTRLGAEQALAGLKANTEQNIANQQLGVEDTAQNRGLTTEGKIGDTDLATGKYIGETGYNITNNADNTASNRAATIATNRQGAVATGQNNAFNNNLTIANAKSSGAQTVANAKRADEQEGRGYLTGQQAAATNTANTTAGQRISNYGTQTGAVNDASKANAGYQATKDASGWGSVFKSVVGNALGAAATAGSKKYIGG